MQPAPLVYRIRCCKTFLYAKRISIIGLAGIHKQYIDSTDKTADNDDLQTWSLFPVVLAVAWIFSPLTCPAALGSRTLSSFWVKQLFLWRTGCVCGDRITRRFPLFIAICLWGILTWKFLIQNGRVQGIHTQGEGWERRDSCCSWRWRPIPPMIFQVFGFDGVL